MATHLGYHNHVIARAVRPVAISWYNLQTCCAVSKIVPGDCHVASLLAMTAVIGVGYADLSRLLNYNLSSLPSCFVETFAL